MRFIYLEARPSQHPRHVCFVPASRLAISVRIRKCTFASGCALFALLGRLA